MSWTPGGLSQRRALEAPFVDVPEHLEQHLWGWIRGGLTGAYGEVIGARIDQLSIHMRIPSPEDRRRQLDTFRHAADEDSRALLTIAEAMLEVFGSDMGHAEDLAHLLASANSAYAVNSARDGLEMRVAPGVKESVQAAADAAPGSAGTHLVNAWNEAYGRHPDPVKSYSESIKAAEAALARIVSPENVRATLGTLIRDISAKPSKWEFVLGSDGVATVLGMMRTLWTGQTSRHGGVNPTRDETPDEARAAVHISATLVQFGASAALRASP